MKIICRMLAVIMIIVLFPVNNARSDSVLNMPEDLKIIKEEAFYGSTSIGRVELPDTIEEIHARAFANSSLSEINLPDSLTFIDPSAFDGPDKVDVKVNPGTYAYDWALDNHYILSGGASNGKWTPVTGEEPEGTEYFLEIWGFWGMRGAVDANGNECPRFVSIQDDTMYRDLSISDESDPEAWVSGKYLWDNYLAQGKPYETYVPYYVYVRTETEERVAWSLSSQGVLTISGTGQITETPWDIDEVVKLVIEDGITGIGISAFSGYPNLTSAIIPGSVAVIGNSAFDNCNALSNVIIQEGVSVIERKAFLGCDSLAGITLPESLVIIDGDAFWDCGSLSEIYIPAGVAAVGAGAFGCCYELQSIIVSGQNPEYMSEDGILYNKDQTILWGCPAGRTGDLTVPDGVTTVGKCALQGCKGLTGVYLPDSVVSIEELAFNGCKGMVSITLPTGLESIGVNAFWACINLNSLTIPDTVTYVGDWAFGRCSSLTYVQIPSSIGEISRGMFNQCSGLTEVLITDGITAIREKAFDGCTNLEGVIIPVSVTQIGDLAFIGCENLHDVYFTGSSEQWDAVSIGSDNECMTNIEIHFDYTGN